MKRWTALWGVVAAACAGCSDVDLDPPAEVIHARFDPEASVIPMPTDILRDAEMGRLDIPMDDEDLTPAELEFYAFLNQLDGWSSAMAATVELTAPINPATVDTSTIQVWHWRETPQRVDDITVTVDETETKITIDAPREGWERGGNYVVLMRGGSAGIEGKQGEPVLCDAAFYFLRLTQPLDVPEHERAFPGDTAEERRDNARKLEEIRAELSPYFDFFEARGVGRDEVSALWTFTVTERVELAMDKASQRMPLPINLLIDPDTLRVDLPPAAWDSETVANAKIDLAVYDGFGTSQNLMFGFTGPIDPDTIDDQSVQVYEVADPPVRIPAELTVLDDLMNVEIEPLAQPLKEKTRYAVVVRDSVRDAAGDPVITMPAGHFMRATAPVFIDGASQVGAVDDADARKLERVRTEVQPFLSSLGDTDDVLASWTFTTMSIEQPFEQLIAQPEILAVDPDPANVSHMTPGQALGDFALAIGSLFSVADVYNGTIESPVFLDPITRGMRTDGGYEVQDIHFTMTVPRNVSGDEPVPVVIFGHGVMTERRFVLAIGDALAAQGFVAISIDFPFHGERTYCWHEGPLSIPDPTTGELTPLGDPCANGTTCAEDGRCVDAANQGDDRAVWPVIGMPQASGAAFIEIEHIANTRDHFIQSVIDLKALSRSLQLGDWESVIGAPVDTSRLMYAGQSLGGIIGATFVSVSPEINRAVLNVPGADTVDLFRESDFFGAHVDAFFTREGVDPASYDGHRFLNVARWFMDSADPANYAEHLMENADVMIQMATLDFIIPNTYTLKLQELSGAPRVDYTAEHAFLVIPVEPEYGRGTRELAAFLAGEFTP